jgi:hypothetical protein
MGMINTGRIDDQVGGMILSAGFVTKVTSSLGGKGHFCIRKKQE